MGLQCWQLSWVPARPPQRSYLRPAPCQPPNCLYAVDGDSLDWAYGELGAPAYTTEISGGDAAYLKDVVGRLEKFFAGQKLV